MNKEKLIYEAPEAETFVVQTEGMICVSNPKALMLMGTFGDTDKAGEDLILDDGFNL